MKKYKAVLIANNVAWVKGDVIDYIYGPERLALIDRLCEVHPARITSANLAAELPALRDVEVIFSCWGMIPLTEEQLDQLPNLKAVFYASGSVQHFAKPFIERDIVVCNAMEANAIPVAEFCLAQILLVCKGTYRNSQLCRRGPWVMSEMPIGRGVYGETVALLGIGAISRHLLQLLKPFNLRVIAVSNYLKPAEAEAMGIKALVDIETAFKEAYIVSNHLADKPSNTGILAAAHFASMRKDATFINTGRGAQVNETGLIETLKSRPDLTALLDVQHPEPPVAGSELYTLPNVYMTGHIAGSANDEVRRMADFMINDFKRWAAGQPLAYQVNPKTFASRA